MIRTRDLRSPRPLRYRAAPLPERFFSKAGAKVQQKIDIRKFIALFLTKMTKKFYIETYGCQMNVADSEVVAAIMQTTEAEMTDTWENADVIILNTCSIRDNAEQKVGSRLRELKALLRNHKSQITNFKLIIAGRLSESSVVWLSAWVRN